MGEFKISPEALRKARKWAAEKAAAQRSAESPPLSQEQASTTPPSPQEDKGGTEQPPPPVEAPVGVSGKHREPVMESRLIQGDCLEVLRQFPDNTFTAVVTDPPYGLSAQPDMREVLRHWLAGDDYEHRGSGFMGKDWDSFVPGPKIWEEVMRVLKPGGHILSFSGSRTYDLMVTAMRMAGGEVRDKINCYCELEQELAWMQGQGFPKSLNIGKAIDKAAGAERQPTGRVKPGHEGFADRGNMSSVQSLKGTLGGEGGFARPWMDDPEKVEAYHQETAPATDAAKLWDGYGTALKPAHEPIAVFGKDAKPLDVPVPFFYGPKVGRKERNLGCENLFWLTDSQGEQKPIEKAEYERLAKENEDNKGKDGFVPHKVSQGNIWPTVKPIELARYLVKMVKMPGENLILDPFMGSGTTPIACILEGCGYVGIDKDSVAMMIAEARVGHFAKSMEKGK